MKHLTISLLLLWLAIATVFLVQEERKVDKLKDRIIKLEDDKNHLIHRLNMLEHPELVRPFYSKGKYDK